MTIPQELPPLIDGSTNKGQQSTSTKSGATTPPKIFRKGPAGNELYVVFDLAAIKNIVEADPSRIDNSWGEAINKLLGDGAVGNQRGPPHTRARQILCKGFTWEAIIEHLPAIAKTMETYLSSWASSPRPVPLLGVMKQATSDIADHLILGDITDADRNQMRDDCTALTAGFAGHEADGPDKPSLEARQRLLATYKRYIAPSSAEASQSGANSSGCPLARLNAGFANSEGGSMGTDEMLDQCMNLVQAGAETVPFTLANLLIELGNHPEILTKLAEEQSRLVEQHGKEVTAAVLDEMIYGEAVSREGVRIHSPVPGIFRVPKVDIEVAGYRVPKGSRMQLILQQPVAPVCPEKAGFCPERWLDSTGQLVPWPPLFIPFGGGDRHCIGFNLAKIQIKVMLALFARNFSCSQAGKPVDSMPFSDLTHDDVVLAWFKSVVRPEDAVMMKFSHDARVS